MQTVLDYARKLLHEHDCVVIPELGGFLAHFNHAFYSEQNALYHAPQKRIAFNEALKLDDGLLVHFLTVNEQITREEAHSKVVQFVDHLKKTIVETGEYQLNGMGTLRSNYEGRLFFEPEIVNFLSEGFGFDSLAVETIQPTIKIQEVETEEIWTTTNREPQALEVELPRRRRSKAAIYTAGGILLTGAIIWGSLSGIQVGQYQSSMNPLNIIPTVQSLFESKKIEKPIVKQAVKAVVNQPLVIAPPLPEITKPVVAEPKTEAPASKKEEVIVSKKPLKAALPTVPTQFVSDANPTHLIVAGSFSKLENAQKLEQTLKDKGYQNAYIMNPNAVAGAGELIKVAALALDNQQKAQAQIANISRIAREKACVVKYTAQ